MKKKSDKENCNILEFKLYFNTTEHLCPVLVWATTPVPFNCIYMCVLHSSIANDLQIQQVKFFWGKNPSVVMIAPNKCCEMN